MDWRQQNIRLRRLEAEAIEILREAAVESHNPVMLYSIGKDSGAMLHLAQKAFAPGQTAIPTASRCKFSGANCHSSVIPQGISHHHVEF